MISTTEKTLPQNEYLSTESSEHDRHDDHDESRSGYATECSGGGVIVAGSVSPGGS